MSDAVFSNDVIIGVPAATAVEEIVHHIWNAHLYVYVPFVLAALNRGRDAATELGAAMNCDSIGLSQALRYVVVYGGSATLALQSA